MNRTLPIAAMTELTQLLPQIVDLARQAGDLIAAIYHTDFAVQDKPDQSPLTAADLAAHNHIVAGLAGLTDWPILSEEAADIPWAVRREWQRYWLVDPLDGTKEFIKRNGEFTVNIALIEQGVPVLGVVLAPVTRRAWFAAQGVGAFCQNQGESAQPIRVAQVGAGAQADAEAQAGAGTQAGEGALLRVVGSRSHNTPEMDQFLRLMGPVQLVSVGSSLKFCLLAEGAADLYPRLGPTSEWDTAAAQCVVEQAGGEVLNVELQPLRYNQRESLLNPYFVVCASRSANWLAAWRGAVRQSGTQPDATQC
jgi:3'(2'), 5'-bisphosphate nucleotidase